MPTYAYRGSQCGHEFEVRQSFAEDPITECVDCGQPVHRVIHPAGIVFKGTGWYITDSRPTTDPAGGVHDAAKMTDKKTENGNGSTDVAAAKPETKAEPAAVGASTGTTATATATKSGKDS
jgi:putative FmdB family regulatory protein